MTNQPPAGKNAATAQRVLIAIFTVPLVVLALGLGWALGHWVGLVAMVIGLSIIGGLFRVAAGRR